MQSKKCTLANCITGFRILGTLAMIFTVPFSTAFFVVYSLCGLSDVLDGFVARVTKSTSDFGAKLDSVADLLFYFVMAMKILPVLLVVLPLRIWIVVISTVVIRIISYSLAAVKYRRFASQHTIMNKVTGMAAFGIPYFINTIYAIQYCTVGATIAIVASLEELFIHIKSKEYNPRVKTILQMNVQSCKKKAQA